LNVSKTAVAGPGFVLKHRIVGALILIGFGVIGLPWILNDPAPPSAPAAAPQPATDDSTKVFVSRITPIGGGAPPVVTEVEPSRPTPSSTPSPAPNADKATAADNKATASAPAAEPAAKAAPAAKAEPVKPAQPAARTQAKAAAPVDRGWVVRIGTYTKNENTQRVVARLKQNGFEPATGQIKTSSGMATRVWVGPYAQRVDAARVRSRIERLTGEKGLITPYP